MSSEDPLLDFDRLLSPVSEDRPSGESLQYSGLFDEIREARRADDVLEQGDWKRELKVADWDEAAALATDALLTRTKDLQVAAWLAEALTMLQGFAGARDGLKLMKGLHAQFWDTCYPEIDEGDMEGRANVLSFLDRQLALSLRKAPLTRAPGMNFSWLEWNESRAFDIPESITGPLDADSQSRLAELKRQAVEENKTSGEDFRKAKASTPKAYYESSSKALAQAWDEFQGLDRVMDEKFGRQTPGLSELKKSIEEVRRVVDSILKEKRALEPDALAGVVPGPRRGRWPGRTGVRSSTGSRARPGLFGAGARLSPSSAKWRSSSARPSRTAPSRTWSSGRSRGARCRSRPGLPK